MYPSLNPRINTTVAITQNTATMKPTSIATQSTLAKKLRITITPSYSRLHIACIIALSAVRPRCIIQRMTIPEQQEQPIEERVGSAIGKAFVLALIAFFLWGYSTTLLAKLGFF